MAANYKCTAIGCYSYQSPETNTRIRKVQEQINRFSALSESGFSPIGVDGVIGKGSLTALLIVLSTIIDRVNAGFPSPQIDGWGSVQQLHDAIKEPEDVVRSTVLNVLPGYLLGMGDALNTPAMVAASPTAKPNTIPTPTGSASAAALAALQASNPNTKSSIFDSIRDLPTWAKYGGGFAAIGGLALLLTGSKKRKQKALTAG